MDYNIFMNTYYLVGMSIVGFAWLLWSGANWINRHPDCTRARYPDANYMNPFSSSPIIEQNEKRDEKRDESDTNPVMFHTTNP